MLKPVLKGILQGTLKGLALTAIKIGVDKNASNKKRKEEDLQTRIKDHKALLADYENTFEHGEKFLHEMNVLCNKPVKPTVFCIAIRVRDLRGELEELLGKLSNSLEILTEHIEDLEFELEVLQK